MSETQQVTKKQSTGTAWIVWGAILMAWGLFAGLRSLGAMAGAELAGGGIAALIFIGAGVWLLMRGLNKRRANH